MASYFDHFIVTKIFTDYLTDSSIIMISVVVLYMVLCNNQYIVPSRFQSVVEIIIEH
jgi:F0F1-type ATP synthase membrane subunit a